VQYDSPIVVRLTLFVITCLQATWASALADGRYSFSSLSITPSSGSVVFGVWTANAFAQASNSLGELESSFDSGASAAASAFVTWADASGAGVGAAQTGDSSAVANIPGCILAQASSTGRGSVAGSFEITGGAGAVEVAFSVALTGFQDLLTDACGLLAESEIVFALEVDGSPVAVSSHLVSIGPNSAETHSYAETASGTATLEFGQVYSLLLEVDSESRVVNTPEPATGAIVFLLMAAGFQLRRSRAA
jgi:hypothetical protein